MKTYGILMSPAVMRFGMSGELQSYIQCMSSLIWLGNLFKITKRKKDME